MKSVSKIVRSKQIYFLKDPDSKTEKLVFAKVYYYNQYSNVNYSTYNKENLTLNNTICIFLKPSLLNLQYNYFQTLSQINKTKFYRSKNTDKIRNLSLIIVLRGKTTKKYSFFKFVHSRHL